MLDVSVLYGGLETPSTPHRYGRAVTQIAPPPHQKMAVARSARGRRPIVVWNLTRTCNLKCAHCYTDSESRRYDGELTTAEACRVLEDLADFRVPAVLFSGGEPLVRKDLFGLAAHARHRGLHVVLSTNGTLITREVARKLKDHDFAYVGISLDSAFPEVHDRFRGVPGAWEKALRGFRHCREVGQKVGLRLTLSNETCENLDALFDLIEREGIDRACFYHLVPAGRGDALSAVPHDKVRRAMDTIIARSGRFIAEGRRVEILTVDNACDGPYLWLRMLQEGHPRAAQVLDMLRFNGGARWSSGVGVADIDFHGEVHADQFSMRRSFGNVKDRPFGAIWQDLSNPVMAAYKERLPHLSGRCAGCRFKQLCGGSLRARAENTTGDLWAPDPGCYLSDEEIAGPPVVPEEATPVPAALRPRDGLKLPVLLPPSVAREACDAFR